VLRLNRVTEHLLKMSDDSPNIPGPLVTYFDKRFRKPNGEPYKKRQRDAIIKKFRLPVIRIGWTELIVPAQGDARLVEFAGLVPGTPQYVERMRLYEQEPPQHRRRGRPRKLAAD
jgi:hypothetical protein